MFLDSSRSSTDRSIESGRREEWEGGDWRVGLRGLGERLLLSLAYYSFVILSKYPTTIVFFASLL
jgi:hypothetical protein